MPQWLTSVTDKLKAAWASIADKAVPAHVFIVAVGLAFMFGGCVCGSKSVLQSSPPFGYTPDPEQRDAIVATMIRPLFADAGSNLKGSWDRKTNILLYQHVRKANGGKDIPVKFQQRGTCVSMAASNLVNYEQWVMRAAGEPIDPINVSHAYIYACAKEVMHEIGPKNRSDKYDGLFGAAAAEAVSKFGVVSNEEAGDSDRSDKLAIEWAVSGVPNKIKEIGKTRKIGTTSVMKTFDEVADAAANGYPTNVCSGVGYQPVPATRDKDGFLNKRGEWHHGMCLIGVVNVNGRIGAVCLNSWDDNWISGPNPLDLPAGCFCIDEKNVNEMLKNINPFNGRPNYDSFTYSSFEGFPRHDLPFIIQAPNRRDFARRPDFALAF